MASSEDYLAYVLDLLAQVPDVSHRKMMGEYVLYAQGKVFGGIYDDRFLVKPTDAAKRLLPDAGYQLPYEGAKLMLAVDVEDKQHVAELVAAVCAELPEPKKRKAKNRANRQAASPLQTRRFYVFVYFALEHPQMTISSQRKSKNNTIG